MSWAPLSPTAIIHAPHPGAECNESLVHSLVTALDLADVVDDALSFGAERGDEKSHARADVGRIEGRATQCRWSRNKSAMRVAQDNLRTHRDQFVDEEQSRLEHLLMHHDQAFALCRCNDRDGHRIRRERRPRLIFELGNVIAQVRLNFPALLSRHDEIIAILDTFDAESSETHSRRAKVLDSGGFDSQLGARGRRESDERSNLDVIRSDRVVNFFAPERTSTFDDEVVRADAFDASAHRRKEMGEILHVRLTRCFAKTRLHFRRWALAPKASARTTSS